jgi:hypothetical protein
MNILCYNTIIHHDKLVDNSVNTFNIKGNICHSQV